MVHHSKGLEKKSKMIKKIKLDPFTIALVILVLLILFSIVGKYLNSARSRIAELEEQIRQDLQLLELSKDQQEELVRKAAKSYRIVVTLIFSLFISLISLTVFAGYSYIDALEIHLGTAGIILCIITVTFYQTWSPDVLLKALRGKIKKWIYQRNGFDPAIIALLQSKINISQLELEELRMQQGDIYTDTERNNMTEKHQDYDTLSDSLVWHGSGLELKNVPIGVGTFK